MLAAIGAVLLAVLSAYMGYYAGWTKDQQELQRRRVALGQSLLLELLWLDHTLREIRAEADPSRTSLRLSTFIFEKFSLELLSLQVTTLRAVLRVYASVNHFRGSLSRQDTSRQPGTGGSPDLRPEINVLLDQIRIAHLALTDTERVSLPAYMIQDREYFYPTHRHASSTGGPPANEERRLPGSGPGSAPTAAA